VPPAIFTSERPSLDRLAKFSPSTQKRIKRANDEIEKISIRAQAGKLKVVEVSSTVKFLNDRFRATEVIREHSYSKVPRPSPWSQVRVGRPTAVVRPSSGV
jgi:hypothetical protein